MLYLNDLQSSLFLLLIIPGVRLVMPELIDREKTLHRAILLSGSAFLALRYIWWRGTETLPPAGLTPDFISSVLLFGLELLTIISGLSAMLIMTRYHERGAEADAHEKWWDGGQRTGAPRVAVMIATYNEDFEVLERTIVGALWMKYPNFEVVVLDDGRREWLRDYCRKVNVRYVCRPDNVGAKAGNLNHGIAQMRATPARPEFIAVLDADFVPHRNFLNRTVALMHDPRVGLVATPQHFFNSDPIQHNLGLHQSYPDEQRFFFDHLQPSRDAWGIPVCAGTSSLVRMSALDEVGGFSTESVTEDFMLTLTLQDAGYSTVYLNEALSEGLAPEGLKEYITQRARWCLGMMQIARSRMGPLSRNRLRLRDRWSALDSVTYWFSTFPFRIAALVFPLLYWYFNITAVNARVADVVSYFGLYYLWSVMVLNFLTRGVMAPVLMDVSQLLAAAPITRAAMTGLFFPKGHKFKVTAKGGDRSKVVVQWRLMAPFAILLVLTIGGLLLGLFDDNFAYYDAGSGKQVILFWTFYNVLVLSVTIMACIELPRRERHMDFKPERVSVGIGARRDLRTVWLASLTQENLRLRGARYQMGDSGFVEIPGVGHVRVAVETLTSDGAWFRMRFVEGQQQAVIRKLYAEGAAPGVGRVSFSRLIDQATRRLSFDR